MVRMVLAGKSLGYVAGALRLAPPPPDQAALRSQLHGYAVGLGGFLAKIALARRPRAARRAAAARRRGAAAPHRRRESGDAGDGTPGVHVTSGNGAAEAADALPDGAGARKLRGLLSGPVLYLRSRRRVRDSGGAAPPLTRPEDERTG